MANKANKAGKVIAEIDLNKAVRPWKPSVADKASFPDEARVTGLIAGVTKAANIIEERYGNSSNLRLIKEL